MFRLENRIKARTDDDEHNYDDDYDDDYDDRSTTAAYNRASTVRPIQARCASLALMFTTSTETVTGWPVSSPASRVRFTATELAEIRRAFRQRLSADNKRKQGVRRKRKSEALHPLAREPRATRTETYSRLRSWLSCLT